MDESEKKEEEDPSVSRKSSKASVKSKDSKRGSKDDKAMKKSSKDDAASKASNDSFHSTEEGPVDGQKDKGKGKRGSLKFGEEEDDKGTKKAGGKGKGKEKPKEEKEGEESKGGFNPDDYQKPTVVIFHDNDDLMMGKGVMYKPDDAVPKVGPGVTSEIEKAYGPCTLLTEFKYTTWADTVVPLRNHNVVQGFNEMALCLIKLAANEGEDMSHEDAFLAVSFLSNVRNDLGEYPPNILALIEHIDYITKGDRSPQFKKMDACHMNEWY